MSPSARLAATLLATALLAACRPPDAPKEPADPNDPGDPQVSTHVPGGMHVAVARRGLALARL